MIQVVSWDEDQHDHVTNLISYLPNNSRFKLVNLQDCKPNVPVLYFVCTPTSRLFEFFDIDRYTQLLNIFDTVPIVSWRWASVILEPIIDDRIISQLCYNHSGLIPNQSSEINKLPQ